MKTHFFMLLLSLVALLTQAQPTPGPILSLAEAQQIALSQRPEVATAAAQAALAANDQARVTAAAQPRVTLNGDARYSPLLQTSILPGDVFGGGGADREIQFGTRFNLLLGAQADYLLWDPTRAGERQAAALRTYQGQLDQTITNRQIRVQVAEAYYQTLLRRQQASLAQAAYARAQLNADLARVRAQAGALLPADLNRFELDLLTAESQLRSSQRQEKQAQQQLCYQLGWPLDTLLPALSSLAELPLPGAGAGANFTPSDRAEWKSLTASLQLAQINQTLSRQQYLPKIQAYANLSAQHLSNDLAVWQRWFPFGYLGLNSSWTLYDGRLQKLSQQRWQLQAAADQARLTRLEQDLFYAASTAITDQQEAYSQVQLAERALDLARTNAATDQNRFAAGALGVEGLQTSEYALRTAENQLLAAYYEVLVAHLRWQELTDQW